MHGGDEVAAAMLWERHAPTLRRYAASLLHGDEHLAGDVTCEVMLHVLELRRSQVEAVLDVAAWLAASCRRRAISCIRAARRRKARENRFESRFGTPHDAADGDDLARLTRSIDALPHRLREPVVLHDLCGLTFEQASLATGIPRATLADRHRAAIVALQAAMRAAASNDGTMRAPIAKGGSR